MKKKVFIFSLILITLCSGFIFSSCNGNDDPDPEIVDEIVYYITGEVNSEGKALEGVTVKVADHEILTDTNGSFQFELPEKGNYKVYFSKSGYVTVSSDAFFSSDAKNRTGIILKQVLAKKVEPVKVDSDKNVEVLNESAGISLFIPEGALKESTDISVTPFIPGVKNNTNGKVSITLLSLNMEPDGLKFDKPVEISFSNPMSSNMVFDNIKHMVEENGILKEVGGVTYDKETNSYKAILEGFSIHSFMLSSIDAIAGPTPGEDVLISTALINNLGNPAFITPTVNGTLATGWMINDDNNELSPQDISDISTAMSSIVGGSQPGISYQPTTTSAYALPNSIFRVEFWVKTETYTVTVGDVTVDIVVYTGFEIKIIDVTAEHSGGAGS